MEIIHINTVGKCGNILLKNCLPLVNEMLPVFIVFLCEHLSAAMFDLYRLTARGWVIVELNTGCILSKDAGSK